MGNLFSAFIRFVDSFGKRNCRVLMVGLDGAGETCPVL
jgi:hypothetical protein